MNAILKRSTSYIKKKRRPMPHLLYIQCRRHFEPMVELVKNHLDVDAKVPHRWWLIQATIATGNTELELMFYPAPGDYKTAMRNRSPSHNTMIHRFMGSRSWVYMLDLGESAIFGEDALLMRMPPSKQFGILRHLDPCQARPPDEAFAMRMYVDEDIRDAFCKEKK